MNEDTIKTIVIVLTLIFWCRLFGGVVLIVNSNYTSVSLYEIKVVIKHVILDESLRLYGQAFKRAWWMPWQLEAMKDVVGHERPRGAAKQALIRGCPNGETWNVRSSVRWPCPECIGVWVVTRGSETS